MSVELLVCETCRREGETPEAGPVAGARLAERMERALADTPDLDGMVRLRRQRCLMSCRRACSVAVRAPERMSYVLGDFPPDDASVETLVAYARAYCAAPDGVVPFKQWPQGVKGRFVSRMPSFGGEAAPESKT